MHKFPSQNATTAQRVRAKSPVLNMLFMTCCARPRVQDEFEVESRRTTFDQESGTIKHLQQNAKNKDMCGMTGRCFDTKALSMVFPEDYKGVKRSILNPRGPAVGKWNNFFFAVGLVSLFIDPLFLYLPVAEPDYCFETRMSLQIVLTIVRSVLDIFYIIHIAVQLRTAYIAPSSRVFGRGELVIDPWKIAYRYLVKGFWVDFMSAIPLPQACLQILVWAIIPNSADSVTAHSHIVLRFTIMLQYFLRFALIYPLSSQIVNATGVMTSETAWVGAAYNMMLYLLASYRRATRIVLEKRMRARNSDEWRYVLVFLAQVLLLYLDWNPGLERYLQSITARLEEWRLKRTDTEQWMHHRQLPHELKESVRKYGQFKWVATQGVDEQTLLNSLPADLQREIKRHLCLGLVQQVPLLNQMDDRMLDAICERLKPAFCIKGTFLLVEGDPVDEMLFIIRGHLDSYTTNGGRTGFFNSSSIGPGDFCGEELLNWALDQQHSDVLPSSTRTVEAMSEVEAFRLTAEDLIFVASQFRRLHSRELIHKFRFYSHQWRTWAASFIQAAWRRHKKRKGINELNIAESERPRTSISQEMNFFVPKPGSGLEVYATRLMNMRRAASVSKRFEPDPAQPDFIVDEE
ncbi:hypothetical protein TEA_020816 [Camellia sinensis var. sinensis]|uniref:Cyclic nucleotide-binding domain-containing protein n=1 Tax=Camellia sinensis var. sinensis TaxID=542762 RepID=A0A4S4EZH4_CAMSN|nr:hypothetical protein TEA_020816 [Camellia sinensis var. sinensis]